MKNLDKFNAWMIKKKLYNKDNELILHEKDGKVKVINNPDKKILNPYLMEYIIELNETDSDALYAELEKVINGI